MTNEIADYVSVKLASPFDQAADTTIDVVATNSIYEMVDQKTTSVFQDFRLSIFEKTDIAQKITVGITSAVANGTLGGLNRYTLTILDSDGSNSMIGLANTDDGTDADANIIAGNVSSLTVTEFSTDSVCMIKVGAAEYNEMRDTFDAGNTFNTVTEGESLADTESVSLHTDGKTYLYHATNYPNLVGIQTATTGKYITFGGLSTGHSSLTVGAVQYAEDTGAVTETASATTKYLGVAETATTIRVAPSTPNALAAASQAEAEAGTENTKYTTSLRVKQAATANADIVAVTGAQTVAGVKTFSSSPIVPAPTTDLQAATKKYVDDNTVNMFYKEQVLTLTSQEGGSTWKTVYSSTVPANYFHSLNVKGTLVPSQQNSGTPLDASQMRVTINGSLEHTYDSGTSSTAGITIDAWIALQPADVILIESYGVDRSWTNGRFNASTSSNNVSTKTAARDW